MERPVTGPEHYRQAEQLTGQAGAVMDYEHGVYASMGADERLQRRVALLAEAQVHATLANAAAVALSGITLTLPDGSDLAADWNRAIFNAEGVA
jgi:hypothetical protein